MDYANMITRTKWLQHVLMDRIQLIAHNRQQMASLENQRIYATPHMRAGKYLYLIYPTNKDGSRVREYIGADKNRIKEALIKVENAKHYDRLAAQNQRTESELSECMWRLSNLIEGLENVAPLDLATENARAEANPSPSAAEDGDSTAPSIGAAVANELHSALVTDGAAWLPGLSPTH